MLYNKNQFSKANDKKILHKVKKQWVTISVALFALIGGGALASHVNASANTTNNNDNSNNINQNQNNNANQNNTKLVTTPQPTLSTNQNSSSNNLQNIKQGAKNLHNNILTHAMVNMNQNTKPASTSFNNNEVHFWNSDTTSQSNQSQQNNTKPIQDISDINDLKLYQTGIYNGATFDRISTPFNNININHRLLLHNSILLNQDYPKSSVNHITTHILKAFKQYGANGVYTRYLVNINNNDHYITGNPNFVSFVAPSKDYHYYQNKISNIINKANNDKFNQIQASVNKLNQQHITNYENYMNLYIYAYNLEQNILHPAAYSNSDLYTLSNSDLIKYLETPRINNNYNNTQPSSSGDNINPVVPKVPSNRNNINFSNNSNHQPSSSSANSNNNIPNTPVPINPFIPSNNSNLNNGSSSSSASNHDIIPNGPASSNNSQSNSSYNSDNSSASVSISNIDNTIKNDLNSINSYNNVATSYDNNANSILNGINISFNANFSYLKKADINKLSNETSFINSLENNANSINNNLNHQSNLNSTVNSADSQIKFAKEAASNAKDILNSNVDYLKLEVNASNKASADSVSNSLDNSANNSLTSKTKSRVASMNSAADLIVSQKPQASSLNNLVHSYNNKAGLEENSYVDENSTVQSYLNNANSYENLASSENIAYLNTINVIAAKSISSKLLNNINYADNEAKSASSVASIANSYADQAMSNVSYANSEYISMRGLSTPSTSSSEIEKPVSKELSAVNPSVNSTHYSSISNTPMKYLSIANPSIINNNELFDNTTEQEYFKEYKEVNDIENSIRSSRQYHYYHNEQLYDVIFSTVPTTPSDHNGNNSSNQLINLTPTPLVPQSDNAIPSDLNFSNGASLPTPISTPISGNDNNLVNEYANSDGTGGINAMLYPNGTFLMNGGIEHTGYFSPATMKIGWPNINGTESDNDNYANSISDNENNNNSDSDEGGAPYSRYNKDVISEDFSDVRVTGNMEAQFADQPQMRFFRIRNCNFNNTYNYSDFFAGDKNLQSIQFQNTKGILGGPNSSDSNNSDVNSDTNSDNNSDMNSDASDSDTALNSDASDNNWNLVDPSDWVDTKTGDTNGNDMTNGDVWINRKNPPVSHIFSVPVKAIIQNANNQTITTKQEYASIKGLLGNSAIINLSQVNLPGYRNISNGNAALAFKVNDSQFYYTSNGDTQHWINTNSDGENPTLVVRFTNSNFIPKSNGSNSDSNSDSARNSYYASSAAKSADSSIINSYKNSVSASVSIANQSIANSYSNSVSNSVSISNRNTASLAAQSADNSIAGSYRNSISASVSSLDQSIANSAASSADQSIASSEAAKNRSNSSNSDNSSNSGISKVLSQMKSQVLTDINNDRKLNGRPVLTLNSDMGKIAQMRKPQVIKHFSHYVNDNNTKPSDVYYVIDAKKLGINLDYATGENLGVEEYPTLDFDTGAKIADSLDHEMMYSDAGSNWGHRKAILNSDYKSVGIATTYNGKNNFYIIEDFASVPGNKSNSNNTPNKPASNSSNNSSYYASSAAKSADSSIANSYNNSVSASVSIANQRLGLRY